MKDLNEVVIKVIGAAWCSQCGPYKKSLKEAGVEFQEIDADDPNFQHLLAAWGIRSLPTTLIDCDGVILDRIMGNKPAQFVIDKVKEVMENKEK